MNRNVSNIKINTELHKDFENTVNNTSYVDSGYVDGEIVEYEIIFGNEKIVFIKSGADGSARGYEDKYLKMARRIHERIGATVICASNPDVEHKEIDQAEIRWVISERGFAKFEISFIGTSDGAYHNLSLAKQFPETVKWLGINTSYVSLHNLKKKLLSLPDVYKILIYGTMDDDFNEVVPSVSEITSDNLVVKQVHSANHSFSGMTDEFIALADYLCE